MKTLCKSDRPVNQMRDIFYRDNYLCRICIWRTAVDVYHSCGYRALKGYEPYGDLLAVCHGCCQDLHGFGTISEPVLVKVRKAAAMEIAINKNEAHGWCDIRKTCSLCDGHASYANLLCSDCLRRRSGWNFRVDHRSRQQKMDFHTPEGNENEVKILEDLRGDCE